MQCSADVYADVYADVDTDGDADADAVDADVVVWCYSVSGCEHADCIQPIWEQRPFEIIWPSEKPSDHLAFTVPTEWLSAKQIILLWQNIKKLFWVISDVNSLKLKGDEISCGKCAAVSFEEIRGDLIWSDKHFTHLSTSTTQLESQARAVIKLKIKFMVALILFGHKENLATCLSTSQTFIFTFSLKSYKLFGNLGKYCVFLFVCKFYAHSKMYGVLSQEVFVSM